MKFIFRWLFRLVLLVIVIAGVLILVKDQLLKSYIAGKISKATGLPVTIGELDANLFTPTAIIKDLKIYNPAEIGGSLFIDIPEILIEYNTNSIVNKKMRLQLLKINIREINVVKLTNGLSNIDLLQSPVKEMSKGDTHRPIDGIDGIDILNLSFGSINFIDMTKPASSKRIQIGLQNEIVRNVNSLSDLTGIVLKIILRVMGNNMLNVTDEQPADYFSNLASAFSAICLPIHSDAVAAGEGALSTWTIRGVS
jgi:uncharacterized protein involved in outer membrane biogenesis